VNYQLIRGQKFTPLPKTSAQIDRTAQPIIMRFEAFDAEIYPGPDVCKPEVPTSVTFQHGVKDGKWCDFNAVTDVRATICARQPSLYRC
jgi:hypothetical protein